MRKLALSLILVVSVVPVAMAAPKEVLLKDDYFKPKNITIKKDRKVRFIWKGSNAHNVAISRKGTVIKRSKFMTKGDWTYKFTRRGTFKLVCEVHPVTMTGKVVVE